MKLFKNLKRKNKFCQRFDKVRKSKMAAMKIQDGALVTRYDSSNRFISPRLISGVSFMSISFIVFKKRKGGERLTPPPSPGTAKKAQSE